MINSVTFGGHPCSTYANISKIPLLRKRTHLTGSSFYAYILISTCLFCTSLWNEANLCPVDGTKIQSSNWVLKLILMLKLYFEAYQNKLASSLHSKYYVMFFSILSFYLPSRHKKAKVFSPWSPTRAPPWTHRKACCASRLATSL